MDDNTHILCAIDQNFALDPLKYEEKIRKLMREGLVYLHSEWRLTEKGEEELMRRLRR
jgi:Mn-dependent DtxR family transcriptional regulator